jgi:manganese/zinc/iron transport system permease protein
MGDALSHAVLPGLAVAFIWSGSYSIGPLLIGAVLAGRLSTFLTQTLHQYAGVPSDASMGVVFTALFALGVVLIKKYIHGVHFDMRCVYEGLLELTPWSRWDSGYQTTPRGSDGRDMLMNAAIIMVLWKNSNSVRSIRLWRRRWDSQPG